MEAIRISACIRILQLKPCTFTSCANLKDGEWRKLEFSIFHKFQLLSCINSTQLTHRHLVALIKPRRLYSGNGVGWGQTTEVAHAQHVFECIFLQHMCSINFLIVATPLSYACPASNTCTCWATVYFPYTRSVIIIILHAMPSRYINLV